MLDIELPLPVICLLLEVPAVTFPTIGVGTLRRQTWFPCAISHLGCCDSELLVIVLGPLSTVVSLGIVLQGEVQTLPHLADPDLRDVRNHLLSTTLC